MDNKTNGCFANIGTLWLVILYIINVLCMYRIKYYILSLEKKETENLFEAILLPQQENTSNTYDFLWRKFNIKKEITKNINL